MEVIRVIPKFSSSSNRFCRKIPKEDLQRDAACGKPLEKGDVINPRTWDDRGVDGALKGAAERDVAAEAFERGIEHEPDET